MLKTLKDFNLKEKRILVRCDFNVPLDEKGNILDDFRIKQALPIIKYLIKNKARMILMSHLGKPEGKIVESLRLNRIQEELSKYLGFGVIKTDDCLGDKVKERVKELSPGKVLLLENLRFHKEEENNDSKFAKELSRLGDIYINDAFGSSHRAHASVVGVPKYLPSGIGMLFAKEINVLSRVIEKPWRPLITIIGGVKIESKINVIKNFLEKADHLLLGGQIANTVLVVKGITVGRPLPEREIMKEIESINLTDPKLHLPIDVVVSPDTAGQTYVRESAPGKAIKEELILDIGSETIKFFSNIIKSAKMIVWSGPLGLFESKSFEKGTREIAQVIARNHQAFKIAGGGDTLFALNKFNVRERFDHVSTGGGAMLVFLGGEKLPGIGALEK